jgi:hypothetical protein
LERTQRNRKQRREEGRGRSEKENSEEQENTLFPNAVAISNPLETAEVGDTSVISHKPRVPFFFFSTVAASSQMGGF